MCEDLEHASQGEAQAELKHFLISLFLNFHLFHCALVSQFYVIYVMDRGRCCLCLPPGHMVGQKTWDHSLCVIQLSNTVTKYLRY